MPNKKELLTKDQESQVTGGIFGIPGKKYKYLCKKCGKTQESNRKPNPFDNGSCSAVLEDGTKCGGGLFCKEVFK